MKDFTDPKVVRKLERDARVRDRQDGVTIRNFMSTMAGRQWMWKKLESANVFGTTFSSNGLQMAFNEGNRNQGLLLLNDLMKYCPDEYILMAREANARDTATERSVSEDRDGGTEAGSIDARDEAAYADRDATGTTEGFVDYTPS